MSEPLITVIIATLNSGKTLGRCLDSYRAQNYMGKELIVIDGASSDNTRDIILGNRDVISYWESASDAGIYNAWNKALAHIRGEWVYFLGSDDYFASPEVLRTAAPLLGAAYPAHRVAYGLVDLVDSSGRIWMTAGKPWDRPRFLQEMCIPHQGVFHHKSLFEAHGVFDENFRIAGDYELLLRELKDRAPVFFPGLRVAAMSYGGVSSSPKSSIRALGEIAGARRKLRIRGLAYRLFWAYIKAYANLSISTVLGEGTALKVARVYRRLRGRGSV